MFLVRLYFSNSSASLLLLDDMSFINVNGSLKAKVKHVWVKSQVLVISGEALVWHNQLADILENGTPEQFRNGMTAHPENHLARLFE